MTTFRIDKNHNLVIELDEEDVDEIMYHREQGRSDWEMFPDLIQHYLGNGWDLIRPHEIGAMIDDAEFLLTEEGEYDDHGNLLKVGWVYRNPNSVYRSEVEGMLDQGYVIFQGIE